MDSKANGKHYVNFPTGNFQKETTKKKITSMCRRNNISLSLLCHNIQFLKVSLFVNDILRATLESSCIANNPKAFDSLPENVSYHEEKTKLIANDESLKSESFVQKRERFNFDNILSFIQ